MQQGNGQVFVMSEGTRNGLLQYLEGQPYRDVAGLIQLVAQANTVERYLTLVSEEQKVDALAKLQAQKVAEKMIKNKPPIAEEAKKT